MTEAGGRQGRPAPVEAPGGLTPAVLQERWLVFLRVADSGSLSKAATALGVPQSMVSRHIAQLETACGARLFHRTGRGVELTAFGQQILPRIAQLADLAEGLRDDIRNAGSGVAGEVVIGLLPTSVRQLAGALYSAAAQQLPDVRLRLVEGASAQLEAMLRDGQLDMALVLRESSDSIGDERVLVRLALKLVGRKGDPAVARADVPLQALQGLPLVVPARPHLLRGRLDMLAQAHGLSLCVAVEADSVGLQYEVVAAGGGYAIASGLHDGADERLAAARIVEPVLERLVVLCDSPRRPSTRATRALKGLVCRLFEGDALPWR